MANHRAIATVGQAVLRVLADAASSDFPGVRCELLQAADLQKPRDGTALTLTLYRVVTNAARRNLPSRSVRDGRRRRPPLGLDLYYLLVPWAGTAETQLRLFGWAMRTLDDTPILPSGLLNDVGPETDTFGPAESVELVFESLSLQDLTNVWELMKPRIQPSATFVARLVAIDSEVEVVEAELVQTREFGLGQPVERSGTEQAR